MNEDYKSIEPGTDLGLGLGYSDQFIEGKLTNKSGVGANAGSMVDVKYVTTDSLSELVWSPHKGLSLRCADSSFHNRKSSILWDAAANKTSFALPQSVIAEKSTSNNLLDNRTTILSQAESHLKNIAEGKQTSNRSSPDDAAHMTSEVQMHTLEKGVENFANGKVSRAEVSIVCFKQEDLQATGGVDIIDANIPVNNVLTIGKNDWSYLPVDVNRTNEASMKQVEPELGKVQHDLLDMDPIGGDINEDRNTTAEKDVLQPLNMFNPTVSHPTFLGKLESYAENDLHTNDKIAGCNEKKTIVTVADSSHEVRGSNQQEEKVNCKDSGDSASPRNCNTHWIHRKGKEKALSDGDVQGRMLNNEDNSYGSVESCNSAFLSTSKRRWSFEQQFIVGNKRVKKLDSASGPTSNFGQDSSFMNWISNMMKGFSESVQDEAPSLDLTLAKPDVEHGGLNEEPLDKKSNAPAFSGIGFQSILRALYNPVMRGEEGAPSANFQAKQEAQEIEVIKKSCDLNATPIVCFGESDNFGKQLLLNNENATEFISEHGPTQLIKLKNSPEISCGSHQRHKTRSHENRNSCSLVSGAEREVMHNTALDKCRSSNTENVDCDLPCGKVNLTTCSTSDPLSSLWISRFAAKTSGFMENPETFKLNTKDDSQCSMHSARLIACPQNHVDHHSMDDLDTAVSKEQRNIEATPGHQEFNCHNEQKSISKFKSVLRSPKIRSPEAMASVFARRLGALKHIIPSDLTLNVGHETVTCFFCGARGHSLLNCSEITEREIEDLSRNIRLCNETVDHLCSCIRCFQLNHWAIACPLTASRGQQQSESHALADCYDTGELQLTSGISLSAKPQHIEDIKMDGVASMLNDTDDPNIRLNCKGTEEVKSAAMSISKCVIPRFPEQSLQGSEMVHVDKQNSNIPQVVFNAVSKLRLSRSNILKCMNSLMTLSLLDGFFLRIRLGKWEEGLGGTGYHVACIRGAQLAKNSISVIVRGVECQVQTQYISNHDFLEDELRAWWCTASKDGSRVLPLVTDLRAKVKKKKELGF